jgi:hypothetical protein
MPLLARMLAAPLTAGIRPGAICSLETLLADRPSHGELAGVGALFCAHLRADPGQAELIPAWPAWTPEGGIRCRPALPGG